MRDFRRGFTDPDGFSAQCIVERGVMRLTIRDEKRGKIVLDASHARKLGDSLIRWLDQFSQE